MAVDAAEREFSRLGCYLPVQQCRDAVMKQDRFEDLAAPTSSIADFPLPTSISIVFRSRATRGFGTMQRGGPAIHQQPHRLRLTRGQVTHQIDLLGDLKGADRHV
jgi:hypothetical protein